MCEKWFEGVIIYQSYIRVNISNVIKQVSLFCNVFQSQTPSSDVWGSISLVFVYLLVALTRINNLLIEDGVNGVIS